MLKKIKFFSTLAIGIAMNLSLAVNCFASTSLTQSNFNKWQSGTTKAYNIGTNGICIPEGGAEVTPNYVAAQESNSQTATGLEFYGCFKGSTTAPDGAQEMAVFICDDVTNWTGHEMGFLKTLNDNAVKAYIQGPGGVYKYSTVLTNDNGYHTFKAVVRDSSHADTVDYYVDGTYKCTLQNSGVNYYNLKYYFVGTTHRTSSGWNASGDQIEMYNMVTY
jgi:hypothetical protein